jgi:predicted small secreted protein
MHKSLVCSLLLILFLSVVILSGCNTAKGTAAGIGSIGEGIGKDAQGLGAGIMGLDAWMKKNMW